MSDRKDDIWVIGPTEEITKHYKFGPDLGQPGQYGKACLAYKINPKPDEPIEYAVKIISKARFKSRSLATKEKLFQSFRDEVNIMATMDHPNIIKFYKAFEDKLYFYIVMELCTGGELFDRITARGFYTERDASRVMLQLFKAVDYMHRVKKIAHCDLKPDNCIFANASEDAPLKIIDFGMAKHVANRAYFRDFAGTPYYVAPEVLDGKFNESADCWSLGIIMFVLLHGYPPFHVDYNAYGAYADQKIFELIRQGFQAVIRRGYGSHFPEAIPISKHARDLITKLLVQNFAQRLSAEEALDHPWLTGAGVEESPVSQVVLKGLKKFQYGNKFKLKILESMVNSLAPDDVEALKQTFISMDLDRDGTITIHELKQSLEKYDKTIDWPQIQKIMQLADMDGDGRISYHELTLTSVERKLTAKEERLWNAFCHLDLNHDGRITLDELQQTLHTNNLEELKEMIRSADQDGDGKIKYEEFLTLWSDDSTKKMQAAAAALPQPKGTAEKRLSTAARPPPRRKTVCCCFTVTEDDNRV